MSTKPMRPNVNHKRKRTTQDHVRPAVNPLKKRRRDLTRLLEHSEKLPADVRIGYERELASCNFDLDAAEKEARRSQMIKKYHMVRFFERKKATRTLKKAQQALAEASPSSNRAELEAAAHAAEVDLNYTQYYPLEQAYVSLFAGKKDQETVVRTHPMWKVVEEAMSQGKLQALRDGRYPIQSVSESGHAGESRESRRQTAVDRKSDRLRKKPERRKQPFAGGEEAVSDNEDGGGFFED